MTSQRTDLHLCSTSPPPALKNGAEITRPARSCTCARINCKVGPPPPRRRHGGPTAKVTCVKSCVFPPVCMWAANNATRSILMLCWLLGFALRRRAERHSHEHTAAVNVRPRSTPPAPFLLDRLPLSHGQMRHKLQVGNGLNVNLSASGNRRPAPPRLTHPAGRPLHTHMSFVPLCPCSDSRGRSLAPRLLHKATHSPRLALIISTLLHQPATAGTPVTQLPPRVYFMPCPFLGAELPGGQWWSMCSTQQRWVGVRVI